MATLGIRVNSLKDGVANVTLFIKNGNPEETVRSYTIMQEHVLQSFVNNKCDFGIWGAKGQVPEWWISIFSTVGNS